MRTIFEKNASLLLENPQLAEDFQNIMRFEKFPKNTLLHKSGKVCDYMYFVVSGIARVFYYKEDKDISAHFAAE